MGTKESPTSHRAVDPVCFAVGGGRVPACRRVARCGEVAMRFRFARNYGPEFRPFSFPREAAESPNRGSRDNHAYNRRSSHIASLLLLWMCLAFGALPLNATADDVGPFPGVKSQWNGYDRYDFTCDGRMCILVMPKESAAGKPWIWRARFFGHEPQTDLALLTRGFHLAYMDVVELLGNAGGRRALECFLSRINNATRFGQTRGPRGGEPSGRASTTGPLRTRKRSPASMPMRPSVTSADRTQTARGQRAVLPSG